MIRDLIYSPTYANSHTFSTPAADHTAAVAAYQFLAATSASIAVSLAAAKALSASGARSTATTSPPTFWVTRFLRGCLLSHRVCLTVAIEAVEAVRATAVDVGGAVFMASGATGAEGEGWRRRPDSEPFSLHNLKMRP